MFLKLFLSRVLPPSLISPPSPPCICLQLMSTISSSSIIPACSLIGICFLFLYRRLPAASRSPPRPVLASFTSIDSDFVGKNPLSILLSAPPPPGAWEAQRSCFPPRPGPLCCHPGRPWSSRTRRLWTSAPKCSCMASCGRGPSDGRQPSGPAGEASAPPASHLHFGSQAESLRIF